MESNIISIEEADRTFTAVVNRAALRGERTVLSCKGCNVAAIVPIEDFDLLRRFEDRIDLEEARSALLEAEKMGTISWAKIKRELSL